MNKNSYRPFLCGPHTVSERCYILYSSLFTTFIHCMENYIVYTVSKQQKNHIIYSKYHCSELGNFATFPPCSISTQFSHTRLHLTKCHIRVLYGKARQVTSSITDYDIWILVWIDILNVALQSTQQLTEIKARVVSWE